VSPGWSGDNRMHEEAWNRFNRTTQHVCRQFDDTLFSTTSMASSHGYLRNSSVSVNVKYWTDPWLRFHPPRRQPQQRQSGPTEVNYGASVRPSRSLVGRLNFESGRPARRSERRRAALPLPRRRGWKLGPWGHWILLPLHGHLHHSISARCIYMNYISR